MDGIGGVETKEAHRNRGHARRLLEAAVAHMRRGDAALTMLYGIPDFYPKFGYAPAGPDHFITLQSLSRTDPTPAGFRVRPYTPADLPAIQRIYEQNTATAVGAAVRAPDDPVWHALTPKAEGADGADPASLDPPSLDPASPVETCRVLEEAGSRVRAYAWRGRGFWYVDSWEEDHPRTMVLGEAMADGPAAADAILDVCAAWAREESAGRSEPFERIALGLPPEGHVAAAAMRRHARIEQHYDPAGSSMARVLDVGRLLTSLAPELSERLHRARLRITATLEVRTDEGTSHLRLSPEGVAVAPAPPTGATAALPVGSPHNGAQTLTLELPQAELARLALGAFPPADTLARLSAPLDAQVRQIVEALFPLRHPHLHLPDRF
jgi:hypothetical protein